MSEILVQKPEAPEILQPAPVAPKIVSHFQRFEMKYRLSPVQAVRLVSELRASHMRLDSRVADRESERYTVSSLYFDSPDFMCWQANEAGLRKRFKLRIRTYAPAGALAPLYFLEIKRKDDAVVTKDRVAVPADLFCEFFEKDFNPFALRGRPEVIGDAAALEEFLAKMARFSMRPAARIEYRRLPLVGRYNEAFRVTIDEGIEASAARSFAPDRGYPVFRGRAVLEIKFNNTLPFWFHKILLRHGLRRGKFSKYYNGVRMLRNYCRL